MPPDPTSGSASRVSVLRFAKYSVQSAHWNLPFQNPRSATGVVTSARIRENKVAGVWLKISCLVILLTKYNMLY